MDELVCFFKLQQYEAVPRFDGTGGILLTQIHSPQEEVHAANDGNNTTLPS